MTLKNLQHLIQDASSQDPNGKFIYYPLGSTKEPTCCTYKQLMQHAQRASWSLRANSAGSDLAPGSPVLLHFESYWDNVIWFWAVILAGCVPVISTALPNNTSLRTAHLDHLSNTLMNPLCLTRKNLVSGFSQEGSMKAMAVDSLDQKTVVPMVDFTGSDLGDTAVMMLTSGSTGKSKAVCLSHGQIFAALEGKLSVVALNGQSFLNWIRLDHVASLIEIHLQAILARKDQVHVHSVDVISDPIKFIDLIDRHRVTRAFAPNSFLAKLRATLSGEPTTSSKTNDVSHHWDLSCLDYVATGGEANVTKMCHEVSALLSHYGAPPNVIVPGFGMTETCAGAIFNTRCPEYDIEHKLEFASVGTCMPGIEMRITDDSGNNASLAPGETGNLELKGQVVFKKYFNDPQSTSDSFSGDGWFKTGDRGFIDRHTGYLTLTGRLKETMIINGIHYSPYEIESRLDHSEIAGLTPSFNCCFSFFPSGADTELVCLVYLPTYKPEDMVTRVRTTEAIFKIVMMATGSRPKIIPLSESILQKSALGKLSRQKIKTSYEKGEYKSHQDINGEMVRLYYKAVRTPPKDDFEHTILAVFVESLGLCEEEFGVETPIFDVGITSMEFIKLKNDLEHKVDMDQELPLTAVMMSSTVRELSNALHELRAPRAYGPLVTLQDKGSKAPLWLVHPGAGEVLVFLNLAKYMKDRPVHALRARGFNEGETPFSTIKETVHSYYATIKKQQPTGPYALAGYCYGAMIAFELGKLLEQNGGQVKFVGAFNLPPHIKLRMRDLDYRECLLHLAYFLGLMSEERSRELAVELKGHSEEEVFEEMMRNACPARLAELSFSKPSLVRWASLAYVLHSMAVDYDPEGSVSCVDVFYCAPLAIAAATKEEWLNDHLSKWKDFSRAEAGFHEVPGRHYTMLLPEHVFEFQKILRSVLEARGI
jgi:acyl-CoA synthetase (AMP-forming)/AMP-acid ligase II/thioesterase domain-containing protein